ncbi:hypothetical protein CMV_007417 [Castanea mollissima]|uniref:Uncharacterized protein n=1 Tax=Castanea mollissima TaxID=60419 RepID=A0A8J4VST6_9ROSI|nr:hypothetical protein CMV_007417 [Castanea mollissima]
MRDYGVHESWNKLFSIRFENVDISFYGCTGHGELLLDKKVKEESSDDETKIHYCNESTIISNDTAIVSLDPKTLQEKDPDDEDNHVENIPGISSTDLEDLRIVFHENNPKGMEQILNCFSMVSKAQYLLVNSFYELEAQTFDSLKVTFPFPVYPIGPTNRYLEPKLDQHSSFTTTSTIEYLKWLDSQPSASVLYVSFGSFFELSSTQMDEFAVALCSSGVRFLWVARGEASRLKETCGGDKGLVVPWCDQLRVLCHPSVGGFWSHSGWNSVQETIYAGIPMLAFPLFLDQVPNSRKIEEDWKIGWRVKRAEIGSEILVATDDILQHIQRFMDRDSCEGKETRKRARELKNMCDQATAKGGSFDSHLDAFVSDFLEGNINH